MKERYCVYIILFCLGVLFLLSLTGCSTEKKAAKKVSWLLAHDIMDDNCARLYPNRDSVIVVDSLKIDTLYKEGEIIYDTIPCNKTDSIIYREHKCPPAQIITKLQRHDSIIYRTNTAEADRLNSIIQQKDRQLKEKDDIVINQQKKIDKNDWWKVAALLTWFAIVLGVVFRIFIYKNPI
jgi:hypothetical protein